MTRNRCNTKYSSHAEVLEAWLLIYFVKVSLREPQTDTIPQLIMLQTSTGVLGTLNHFRSTIWFYLCNRQYLSANWKCSFFIINEYLHLIFQNETLLFIILRFYSLRGCSSKTLRKQRKQYEKATSGVKYNATKPRQIAMGSMEVYNDQQPDSLQIQTPYAHLFLAISGVLPGSRHLLCGSRYRWREKQCGNDSM